MLQLLACGRTDKGHFRPNNEDGLLLQPPLYAVADGMGGHRAGEVASRVALEALATHFPDPALAPRSLVEAVRYANQEVYLLSSKHSEWSGMGTTLTAALWDGEALHIAHVGDSRAYLLPREAPLRQVTRDHSVIWELVASGLVPPELARLHPQRHVLTRALGITPEVEIDVHAVPLSPGDRVLLCTDGLSEVISEGELEQALRRPKDPARQVELLVRWANLRGGPDNITALLLVAEVVQR
ncbi:MAG: Stp1/IreP family PP2C-type Ser/Thr phosphatase [Limnochordales bacterium]|nr:Stp1/IreP family PP2C-type Ser/Thr phosphatase [Limnochordales bacterium]